MNDGASDATDPSSFRPVVGRECPVCARFEVAWKFAASTASRPRIQDYVEAVPETERPAALRTLLALELKFRCAKGEQPTPEEYFAAFPTAAAVIYSAFDGMGIWGHGKPSLLPHAEPGSAELEDRNAETGDTMDYRAGADELMTSSTPVVEANSGATGSQASDDQQTMDHGPDVVGRISNQADQAPDRQIQGSDELGTLDYRPTGEGGSAIRDGDEGTNGTRKPGSAGTEPVDTRDRQRRREPERLPKVPGYEILGRLGKGGMGIVYKARHLKLQRFVALKMIIPDRDHAPTQKELERFLAEARVVAQFQHPNLVQIYEIGEHEGRPYFSLELMEGDNLHKKLAGTPQPPARATAQVEILARAMEYAHQKGIVHRDLKPSNVLLTADGTPKVTDFGLAKQMDQVAREADEGGIVGTPGYMAPEQAWGKNSEVGQAADIYALGAIFYEMLTGRPPFKAENKWQTIKLVRTAEPVPPRQLVPQVPRDLELICLRCLEKAPARRFPSARALADELRRYQEGRPILTRPAPWWEKAWKWSRRQPAAASLIAVSIVALLSLVLYLDQRARGAQRVLAEEQRVSKNRVKVQALQIEAEEALNRDALGDAEGKLQAAMAIIHNEGPEALADLEPRLAFLGVKLARRKEEQKGAADADKDYKEFNRLRDLALFHGMVFDGVDVAANMARTKKECASALAIFGVRDDAGTRPVFSKYLPPQRQQECSRACYELLLIWAEAENQQAGPETSLRILNRAAELGQPPTGSYHLRRASYLDLLDQADGARQERERAALIPPREALDYFLTGDSLQKQEKTLPQAAQAFARALRVEPEHFWAQYFLGVCNLRLRRWGEARSNFTGCLRDREKSPSLYPSLYLFRGFVNGQMNDFSAAEEDFRKALSLEPDLHTRYGILVNQGVLCTQQIRPLEAIASWRWLPVTSNLDMALRGAVEYVQQERREAAVGYLEQARQLQPDHYPAYRHLALVHQQKGQPDEAARLLSKALEIADRIEPKERAGPVQSQLLGQRARLHRDQGALEQALQHLDRAAKVFPAAEDLVESGRIRHALKKYTEALVDYEAALKLRPDLVEVYRWKSAALWAMNRGAEAVLAVDQYLAQGGRQTADVYRTRAQVRAGDRQIPAALADFTQSLMLQPHSATHAARGWLFLASGDRASALQDFEAALRLDNGNSDGYNGRGLIRVWRGQYGDALADVEAALRHGDAKTPKLYWNAAHIFAQIAGSLAAEPGSKNPTATANRDNYERKAVEMVARAVALAPKQSAYWRENIAPDALLNPIRGRADFQLLEKPFKGK